MTAIQANCAEIRDVDGNLLQHSIQEDPDGNQSIKTIIKNIDGTELTKAVEYKEDGSESIYVYSAIPDGRACTTQSTRSQADGEIVKTETVDVEGVRTEIVTTQEPDHGPTTRRVTVSHPDGTVVGWSKSRSADDNGYYVVEEITFDENDVTGRWVRRFDADGNLVE